MMRVAMFAVFNLAVVAAGLAAEPAGKPQGDKLRVVLWTGGGSHDYDAIAKILQEDLPKHSPIELRIVRDGSFLDDDSRKFDVVLMNHCYGGYVRKVQGQVVTILTEPQKEKLLKSIREGTGVVAVHCSYWSFPEWKEFHDVFGARCNGHGDKLPITLQFVDRKHTITRELPETITLTCELYKSTPLAEGCHVLALAKRAGAEHPSVWRKDYGKGRVVTILPAHPAEAFRVADFQKLIARSLLWSAGATRRGQRGDEIRKLKRPCCPAAVAFRQTRQNPEGREELRRNQA